MKAVANLQIIIVDIDLGISTLASRPEADDYYPRSLARERDVIEMTVITLYYTNHKIKMEKFSRVVLCLFLLVNVSVVYGKRANIFIVSVHRISLLTIWLAATIRRSKRC